MTPTIICAIEHRTAERVARACGELARDLEARVVLTHVREDPPLFNSTMDRERARNRSTRRGEAVLRRAYDALPAGVDADARVELGIAVTQLADLAEEVDAALIVVGSRGRGRLAAALLGSVSQALARQAPCPVMIIPDNASTSDTGRLADAPDEASTIIAGADGSREPSDTIRFARDLADRLGDRLVIVPTDATAASPAHALQAVCAREHARLIVIGARHRDGARFPPARSVATQLPRLAPSPVIVVPEGAAATPGAAGATDVRRAA